MKKIYTTKEWSGYGKQDYYRNEYRQEEDTVTQYRCNRFKVFDGKENSWEHTEKAVNQWKVDDPAMPEWLKKYV